MNKKIIGIALILFASGAWLYLDYLNQQEQLDTEEAHKAMLQARAQAKARFGSLPRTGLANQ